MAKNCVPVYEQPGRHALATHDQRRTPDGYPARHPALDRYVPPGRQVRGALRLRLATTGDVRIADLNRLDRLPVYLAGDEQVASHLFELLHVAGVASVIAAPGEFGIPGRSPVAVTHGAVEHEGLRADQNLLPLTWTKFHGHNLLHEYFACPARFWFFALNGLAEGLSRVNGREVEIVVLLDRAPGQLANLVDASRFALFCTPVINLFKRHTDRIEISPARPSLIWCPPGSHRSTTKCSRWRPCTDRSQPPRTNWSSARSIRR